MYVKGHVHRQNFDVLPDTGSDWEEFSHQVSITPPPQR